MLISRFGAGAVEDGVASRCTSVNGSGYIKMVWLLAAMAPQHRFKLYTIKYIFHKK
jgi:hypothetical protein